jgi:IS5 family transposase
LGEAGLGCDRLSFQRFLGLSLTDPVPDETRICRFRTMLAQAGLGKRLFALLEEQLVISTLYKGFSTSSHSPYKKYKKPPDAHSESAHFRRPAAAQFNG